MVKIPSVLKFHAIIPNILVVTYAFFINSWLCHNTVGRLKLHGVKLWTDHSAGNDLLRSDRDKV